VSESPCLVRRMARRTATRRPIGRGQRAPTTWARTVDTVYTLLPAVSKVLLTTVVLNNPGISETVRRTRGLVSIRSDQNAAVEPQLGAFGAVVVSDLAIAAGAGSIPGPVTEAQDDGWFLWVPFNQTSTKSLTAGALHSVQYEFDSKAMRRVEQGFGVAFMVENASSVFGLEMSFSISVLTSLS